MDGNTKEPQSNIWYIVGRPFEHFAKLKEVTTFDGFLYAILGTEHLGRTVGILGQGLSQLEIQCLRQLNRHFPQVAILGNPQPEEVALDAEGSCFELINQHRVASSRYECDLEFNPKTKIAKEHRLPLHLLIEAGNHFLDIVLKEELGNRDYCTKITQLQCGEINVPFPVQTKIELKVKDIQLKKGQISVKLRQRFYQSGRLSVEMTCSAVLVERRLSEQTQAANAEQTLKEGLELVGV